jgi:hypothetical protein
VIWRFSRAIRRNEWELINTERKGEVAGDGRGFQKGGAEKLGMVWAFSSGITQKGAGVFQRGAQREGDLGGAAVIFVKKDLARRDELV